MADRSGKGKAEELALLTNQCRTILSFAESKGMPVGLEAVLDETVKRGDLRGVRALASDLFEMVKGLREAEQCQIHEELLKTSRVGLPEIARKIERHISKIRKRGRIVGEEEYRLLLERVESIHSDSERREEVSELNRMLAEYKPA